MSEEIFASSTALREASDVPEVVGEAAFCSTAFAGVAPLVITVGQQLASARKARQLSVGDAARALKLSLHQVAAMEGDDWSGLPVAVVRGFVRNYARLLNLDPAPLMLALTALQMPLVPALDFPPGTNTALPEMSKVERKDYAAVFSGIALLFVAVLAYFFFPQDFWQSKLTALTAADKPVVETMEKVASTPVVAEPVPVEAQSRAPAQPEQASSVAASAPVAASNSGLKLSFSQPSWVEIRDRSGEIVFSQLNPAGSQRDIEGQPPFALVIGNATHVTVQYKGKVVELSQRSKDDVARLNLD